MIEPEERSLRIYPALRLTSREREVLQLVREGLTNRQIGRSLSVAEATVAKHLEHIYARTGARSRAHAVALCHDLLLTRRSA